MRCVSDKRVRAFELDLRLELLFEPKDRLVSLHIDIQRA